jgi:two-component system, NtrC family, sensor kinase
VTINAERELEAASLGGKSRAVGSPLTRRTRQLLRPTRHAAAPRRTTLWILLALSWVVPIGILTLAGWRMWQIEFAEAEQRIESTLTVLDDHVSTVFDAGRLALEWARDRTAGLGWPEVEQSQSLHDLLAFIGANYEEISAIYMVDAEGRLRLSDHEFPLSRPVMLADRDYFQALSTGKRSLVVSEPSRNRRSGVLAFSIVLPILRDGRFGGVIGAGINIERFEKRLKIFAGAPNNAVMVMRQDGVVLATYPPAPLGTHLAGGPPFPAQMWRDGDAVRTIVSPADGIKRLVGFRALAAYPVVVGYGLDYAAVARPWFASFTLCAMMALAAGLILSVSALVALRGEQRERVAVAALQSEQVRRLAAEAEARRMSKYEALGTLAGGIAHHFNNLLPAITGHLDIAMKEAGADSPAMPRLVRLVREIDGARRLIRKILLYSRRDVTGFRPVDLSELAGRSTDIFRVSLAPGATLEVDIKPDIHVMGDPTHLAEMLMNLLSNARDAVAEKGGRISLAVDRCVDEDGHPYAQVVCSDTGCGMSPEIAERAFDPFFTTKAPGSGTGLGLAICDGIVRSHGGRIAMDTAAERGTSFTLLIPLLQEWEG